MICTQFVGKQSLKRLYILISLFLHDNPKLAKKVCKPRNLRGAVISLMRQQIRGSPLCRLIHVHKCVWNGRLSRQCLLQWFGHFAFSSIVCVSTNQRSSKKSLVIDGSHAISVASFASGDARIARGRLKCMITAHPSFTRVFFQQHANNQEIDTIANCHATFQYIARRLGRLGDGRSART